MPEPAPLIVTLTLDPDSQAVFDGLRRAHFPPARDHLAAHVTLFHALPGERQDDLAVDLTDVADRRRFPVAVTGLRSLGRGVAYELSSPTLLELRAALGRRWAADLTRQDAAGFRPHVTVQNKVAPAEAKALLSRLRDGFVPWSATAEGLALWHYRGGPWEHARAFPFST